MTDFEDGSIPESARPDPTDLGFDLDDTLDAVVGLRADVPDDAFTAGALGTERRGSGIVIDDQGLVLTIGYLVTEASDVWLSTNRATAVPADVIAYDQVTGFGLLRALGRLDLPALDIAAAAGAQVGSPVVIAGAGGLESALASRLAAKREFAGYWEYLLEQALFTVPAHPRWSGTALLDETGKLLGVGSLLVQTTTSSGQTQAGNMFVPAELLPPIIDDLLHYGRVRREPRPWVGFYPTETDEGIEITATADTGPAATSGVDAGDVVVEVAGHPVQTLAELYRTMWQLGPAGTEIPMTLLRDGQARTVLITSANREDFLRRPALH